MKVSVALPKPGEVTDPGEWREMVAAVESFGIAQVAVDDGQNGDAVSSSAAAAVLTRKVRIAATMLNPITRNFGTLAASLASLNFLSNGRARAVMARGDGAVHNVGLRPATVARMETFLTNLKTLLETGEALDEGRHVILRSSLQPWASGIPIGVVAEGPRMLALAGRLADLVICGFGLTDEAVRTASAHLGAGIAAYGRDREQVELWWVGRLSLHEDRAQAIRRSLTSIESMGNHALRGDYVQRLVPQELHERLAAYHAGYDYRVKGLADGANVRLMQELGLTDYFSERFAVAGDPADVIERLRALDKRGVKNIHLRAHDCAELMMLGREVIPALS
jgi:5,10-methylenetetrahydromethanopterin reductase